MAKIRKDLVGVVSVDGLNLYPGTEVPAGVKVGDHVLEAAPEGEQTDEQASEAPAGNASREAWAAYAESLGIEVLEDDKREDIKDRVEQRESETEES